MTLAIQDIVPAPSLPRSAIRVDGRAAQALDKARRRLLVGLLCMLAAFLGVTLRVVDLAVLGVADPSGPGRSAATAAPDLPRGDIVDRNGVLLATSLPSVSLFADPGLIRDPVAAADALRTVVPNLDRDWLINRFTQPSRFEWISRHIRPSQQHAINTLGVPGLAFVDTDLRVWPQGELASHIVGHANVDGTGDAGIELHFNNRLQSSDAPLPLSLDLRLQAVLTDELERAMTNHTADGAAGLIMDVHTGEILAMVSLPTFDPATVADPNDDRYRNLTTLAVFEMGSVFKIFTTAMGLDTGVTSLTGGYDASRPIRYGRFTINDFHGQGRWLSVPEIFKFSSNIGTAHMALDVGAERQQQYLRDFGLLTRAPVEVPTTPPLVQSRWSDLVTMTVSYGHGLAVTPLQVAAAASAVVNGGVYYPPTLVRQDRQPEGQRVLSEETSDAMRRLMRLVVEEGTGSRANAAGYIVGGKTGTGDRPSGGGYSDAVVSSFVGAFPMTDPQYVVLAMLDNPHGTRETFGYATGGWVAAPVVANVVERMGPIIDMAPIDENDPAVVEALSIEALINRQAARPASDQNAT